MASSQYQVTLVPEAMLGSRDREHAMRIEMVGDYTFHPEARQHGRDAAYDHRVREKSLEREQELEWEIER